jgi:hypothetical protein
MLSVVESPIFQRLWPRYWDEDERAEFASFIALNPDVAPSSEALVASARSAGREKERASLAV